jgi:hypothetical protein
LAGRGLVKESATTKDRLADSRRNQTNLELYSKTVLVTRVNQKTKIIWQLQRKYTKKPKKSSRPVADDICQ